jgi:hypothetical protein
MSLATWGITLRLAGPVVQVIGLILGLIAKFVPGAETYSLGGLPLHRLGVVAFLAGLMLVVAGLILSITSRSRPDPDPPRAPHRTG